MPLFSTGRWEWETRWVLAESSSAKNPIKPTWIGIAAEFFSFSAITSRTDNRKCCQKLHFFLEGFLNHEMFGNIDLFLPPLGFLTRRVKVVIMIGIFGWVGLFAYNSSVDITWQVNNLSLNLQVGGSLLKSEGHKALRLGRLHGSRFVWRGRWWIRVECFIMRQNSRIHDLRRQWILRVEHRAAEESDPPTEICKWIYS